VSFSGDMDQQRAAHEERDPAGHDERVPSAKERSDTKARKPGEEQQQPDEERGFRRHRRESTRAEELASHRTMQTAVIIPTRRRAAYLDVALAGVMPQARALGTPVLVVDDGPDAATREVVARHGARYVLGPRPPRGINGARNAGVAAAGPEPDWLLFLDDDVVVAPDWLEAMRAGAADAGEDVGFLTGPIRARFEDHPLRGCGRERPPVTSMDLGPQDKDAPVAWGVNMGVRRALLDHAGPFDETLVNGGDEEELQARSGMRIRYLARAAVDHRRAGDDARLPALCRAQRARGQAARRFDVSRGRAPRLRAELVVLLGCLGHLVRRRCPQGLVMAAHSLGRIEEAWRPTPQAREDFLSGASGTVGGWRSRAAAVQDGLLDLRPGCDRTRPRRRAARDGRSS
jgi:GT2 family glycosyltransferase